MIVLLLFLFCPLFCTEEFQDLILNDNYTTWSTKGNLTPILFRVVMDQNNPPAAIRVSISSQKQTMQNPLTVNLIRGTTVHDISLPRVQSYQGKKFNYWLATDTLCDHDRSVEQLRQPAYLSIATSLPSDFEILVKSVLNFHIGFDPFEVNASASEPRFYMYTFPDDTERVDIRAYSDSDVCATLVVRKLDCPLFDGSGLLELNGDYYLQSFTKFAGFSVRKSDIGSQFHLAITVNPDESLCGTHLDESQLFENSFRIKTALVSVIPVNDKTFVSLIPPLVYGISTATVVFLAFCKYKLLDRCENNEPSIFEESESEESATVDQSYLFDKPEMVVSHKEYEKQRLVKDGKYFNFLFFQVFGSVLPALTTVFQNIHDQLYNRNLDVYYLNFLCSLDTLHFNSFNAVTSISSVTIVGIINLIVVFRKRIFCYQVPRLPKTHGIQQRKAPKVVFLLSLVAMGVLGIVSSNCACKTTAQFFIYNVSWLYFSAVMWIYSKRHGVRKWQQFYIIAISSIFGCLTLIENMFTLTDCSKIVLKIILLVVSAGSSGYFCFQYYYEKPAGLQEHQWISSPFRKYEEILGDENGVLRPLRSKLIYITAAMGFSIICPASIIFNREISIPFTLLYVGKIHAGIYFFYYIVQKIRFERSTFTRSYVLMNAFLMTLLIFFEVILTHYLVFKRNTYAVWLTPAKSRELNVECVLPGIDWNDILHYNGAFSYFTFIVLMDFIDSNIKGVPKKYIFVF